MPDLETHPLNELESAIEYLKEVYDIPGMLTQELKDKYSPISQTVPLLMFQNLVLAYITPEDAKIINKYSRLGNGFWEYKYPLWNRLPGEVGVVSAHRLRLTERESKTLFGSRHPGLITKEFIEYLLDSEMFTNSNSISVLNKISQQANLNIAIVVPRSPEATEEDMNYIVLDALEKLAMEHRGKMAKLIKDNLSSFGYKEKTVGNDLAAEIVGKAIAHYRSK